MTPGLCAGCGAPLLGPLLRVPDVMVCSARCLAKIRHLLTPKPDAGRGRRR